MEHGGRELYERGKELFDSGLYEEARPILEKVLDVNSEFADVHNKLGVITHLGGDLNRAVLFFKAALSINPDYTEASLNLSIAYADLGRSEEAEKVLEKVVKAANASPSKMDRFSAGKFANEHFKLGNLYSDFGLLYEALMQYERAVSLRPDLPDVQTKYAATLREAGRLEEAAMHLAAAIVENPTYAPAHLHLGLTHYMQGRMDEASEAWEETLRLDPGLKEARTFLDILRKES